MSEEKCWMCGGLGWIVGPTTQEPHVFGDPPNPPEAEQVACPACKDAEADRIEELDRRNWLGEDTLEDLRIAMDIEKVEQEG